MAKNAFEVKAPDTNSSAYVISNILRDPNYQGSFLGTMGNTILGKDGILSNIDKGIREANTNILLNDVKGLTNQEMKDIYDSGSNPYKYVSKNLGTGFVYNPNDERLNKAIEDRDTAFKDYATRSQFTNIINMSEPELEQAFREGKNIGTLWNPENKDYIKPATIADNLIINEKMSQARKNIQDRVRDENFNKNVSSSDEEIFNLVNSTGSSLSSQVGDKFGTPFSKQQKDDLDNAEKRAITAKLRSYESNYNSLTEEDKEKLGIKTFRDYLLFNKVNPVLADRYIDANGNTIMGTHVAIEKSNIANSEYYNAKNTVDNASDEDAYNMLKDYYANPKQDLNSFLRGKLGIKNINPEQYNELYNTLQNKASKYHKDIVTEGFNKDATKFSNVNDIFNWLSNTDPVKNPISGKLEDRATINKAKVDSLINKNPDMLNSMSRKFLVDTKSIKQLNSIFTNPEFNTVDRLNHLNALKKSYIKHLNDQGLPSDVSEGIATNWYKQQAKVLKADLEIQNTNNMYEANQIIARLQGDNLILGDIENNGVYKPKWNISGKNDLRSIILNSKFVNGLDKNLKTALKNNEVAQDVLVDLLFDNANSNRIIKDVPLTNLSHKEIINALKADDFHLLNKILNGGEKAYGSNFSKDVLQQILIASQKIINANSGKDINLLKEASGESNIPK